jgi:hypothetical protein
MEAGETTTNENTRTGQGRERGAEFLTEPKDHELEIRCYLRDSDGHLIELGQGTGILAEMGRHPTARR